MTPGGRPLAVAAGGVVGELAGAVAEEVPVGVGVVWAVVKETTRAARESRRERATGAMAALKRRKQRSVGLSSAP